MISYGVLADSVDDYVGIGKSTPIEDLGKFTVAVVQVFGDEY